MTLKRKRSTEDEVALKRHNGSTEDISPFFSLPREIRDLIYDAVWASLRLSGPTMFCGRVFKLYYMPQVKMLEAVPTYSSAKRKKRHAPWFLLNKMIMKEALEQFNRHCDWEYAHFRPYEPGPSPLRFTVRSQSLINPWVSRELFLNTLRINGYFCVNQNGRIIAAHIRLDENDARLLEDTQPTKAGIARLQLFRVDFMVHMATLKGVYEEAITTVNLSHLRHFAPANLEHVQFNFTLQEQMKDCEDVLSALQAEISRVGLAMVGPEGKVVSEPKSPSREVVWSFEFKA